MPTFQAPVKRIKYSVKKLNGILVGPLASGPIVSI